MSGLGASRFVKVPEVEDVKASSQLNFSVESELLGQSIVVTVLVAQVVLFDLPLKPVTTVVSLVADHSQALGQLPVELLDCNFVTTFHVGHRLLASWDFRHLDGVELGVEVFGLDLLFAQDPHALGWGFVNDRTFAQIHF